MPAFDQLDPVTRDHIGRALWRDHLSEADLPAGLRQRLAQWDNSPAALGGWLRSRLDWLLARPDSYTPDYRARYDLIDGIAAGGLSVLRAYTLTTLLGMDGSRGFRLIPDEANLQFPAAHATDLRCQMGWHREGLTIVRNPAGERVGWGFGEAVAYGETRADTFRIAGVADTPEMRTLFDTPRAGFMARASAGLHLLDPSVRAQLADELGRARGM